MERYNGRMFMGSGQHSLAHIGQTQLLLNRAIDLLGRQQPPMATDPAGSAEAYRMMLVDDEWELEKIGCELLEAVTGVVLTRKQRGEIFNKPT